MDFVEKGFVPKGVALDLCCGAATNTIYLAQKGFEVTGMDISPTALRYARKKAREANVQINFGSHSFVWVPFKDDAFDFVFDMGCFHHVQPKDRLHFIYGVRQVLREGGLYMITCFSYKNGPGWNHFTKKQLVALFSEFFSFKQAMHYGSVDGDGYTRFFYTILMEKKS
jgi:SAM-dependent methyltransferase